MSLLTSTIRAFNTGRYSDFLIRCRGREWKVHRLIICNRSEYFERAANGRFAEAQNGVLDLEEEDPAILSKVLQFIYTARFVVDSAGEELVSHGYHLWSDWVEGPLEPETDVEVDDSVLNDYVAQHKLVDVAIENIHQAKFRRYDPPGFIDSYEEPDEANDAEEGEDEEEDGSDEDDGSDEADGGDEADEYEDVDDSEEDDGEYDDGIALGLNERDAEDEGTSSGTFYTAEESKSVFIPVKYPCEMLVIVQLYSAADRFFVNGLKEEAQKAFESRFEPGRYLEGHVKDLMTIAETIYSTTPSEDRGLRDAFIESFSQENLEKLVKAEKWGHSGAFADTFDAVPEFAVDLLRRSWNLDGEDEPPKEKDGNVEGEIGLDQGERGETNNAD